MSHETVERADGAAMAAITAALTCMNAKMDDRYLSLGDEDAILSAVDEMFPVVDDIIGDPTLEPYHLIVSLGFIAAELIEVAASAAGVDDPADWWRSFLASRADSE